jgi:hypothetical protein
VALADEHLHGDPRVRDRISGRSSRSGRCSTSSVGMACGSPPT